MLKIKRDDQSFSLLETPTLADVSITERNDLQEFIANSPAAFFAEIGQELFLLGKEVGPSKTVQDRIDLLAIDKEGTCVVIELKRGNHKLQLLQAISYAGMISQWVPEEVLQLLDDEQQEALVDFLEVDREEINRQQRIILVAEAYDFALLTAAEWLSEQYGVGIVCCRLAMSKDMATNSEYVVCSNVYPAPELAEEAVSRGRNRRSIQGKWPDWEAALASVTNTAVVTYIKQELAAGRESYLRKRALRYQVAGKRRWNMHARNKSAYVWQLRRFAGDTEFWKEGLSKPDGVEPVKRGKCLRLSLYTADDLQFFHDTVSKNLASIDWLDDIQENEAEELEVANE